jgi:hypothetical protein
VILNVTFSVSKAAHALTRSKTLANFVRIVKVAIRVALVLLASYNVQSNAGLTVCCYSSKSIEVQIETFFASGAGNY